MPVRSILADVDRMQILRALAESGGSDWRTKWGRRTPWTQAHYLHYTDEEARD